MNSGKSLENFTIDELDVAKSFIQSTEMYHCKPSELENEDALLLDRHWILRNELIALAQSQNNEQSSSGKVDTNSLLDRYKKANGGNVSQSNISSQDAIDIQIAEFNRGQQ